MILIQMETEHFSFEAAGDTTAEAEAALVGGWVRHIAQYQGTINEALTIEDAPNVSGDGETFSGAVAMEWYGTNTISLLPGQCSRDGEAIL